MVLFTAAQQSTTLLSPYPHKTFSPMTNLYVKLDVSIITVFSHIVYLLIPLELLIGSLLWQKSGGKCLKREACIEYFLSSVLQSITLSRYMASGKTFPRDGTVSTGGVQNDFRNYMGHNNK